MTTMPGLFHSWGCHPLARFVVSGDSAFRLARETEESMAVWPMRQQTRKKSLQTAFLQPILLRLRSGEDRTIPRSEHASRGPVAQVARAHP